MMRSGWLRVWSVAAVMLSVAGCGTDPVKSDLEQYCKRVIVSIAEAESKTVDEVKALPEKLETKEVAPGEILGIYENKLLPRYREVLDKAEGFAAKTPPVAEVNKKLISLYREAIGHLEACVKAIKAKNEEELKTAHKALAALNFEPFRTDLEALVRKHGVVIETKPTTPLR